MPGITVLLASDHRGFSLKGKLIGWLKEHGFAVKDLGTGSEERCDSSDFAVRMAGELIGQKDCLGVLICGTGNGIAMAANRYREVRAALCFNTSMARFAREHNDANVIVFGADMIGTGLAIECLDVFLRTGFLGGRYAERRNKLSQLGGL